MLLQGLLYNLASMLILILICYMNKCKNVSAMDLKKTQNAAVTIKIKTKNSCSLGAARVEGAASIGL